MFLLPRRSAGGKSGAHDGIDAALDVGTTKVCCFAARVGADGRPRVVGIGHQLSRGIKGGAVVDLDAAEASVRATVDAAERMAGEVIREAWVNISAGHQRSQTVGVEVAVTGHQVAPADTRRAIEQAMLRAEPGGREVVHAIPLQYSIDGTTGIDDPHGMFATRLGVNLHVVTADTSPVRNLSVCIGRGDLEALGPVSSAYASGLACLVDDEMQLGTTIIDMGGGITSVGMFLDGGLVLVESVPLGGQHVTNDLARGLGTTTAHAERMKTLWGGATAGPGDDREMIDVPPLGESGPSAANHVPRTELVRIIAPRIEELFEMVGACLHARAAERVAGRTVVLTGGAAQLDGAAEIAARVLGKHVRIGRPAGVAGLAESTAGPAFAACAGTLLYAASGLAAADVGALAAADKGGSALVRMGRWLRANL